MYIYIYMYIYICICTHYLNAHVDVGTDIYIQTCICIAPCTYMCVWFHVEFVRLTGYNLCYKTTMG